MNERFLLMCFFGIGGLTCNCTIIHRHDETDIMQPFENALDRSARDLIGYNRQRNTAFQIRQKLFEKATGKRQGISDFRIKVDENILKHYQKQLAAFRKRKRIMIAKRLGY